MKILGIDPSVNNVGIAYYDTEMNTLKTECFHPTRDSLMSMPRIAVQIARHIHIVFLQGKKLPDKMVIEYPQWENSQRGIIAAQKGYILDLAFIVGYLCGSIGLSAKDCIVPTVAEWKGTLPIKAIEERFLGRFGNLVSTKVSEHEHHAAMLIAWAIKDGKLNA